MGDSINKFLFDIKESIESIEKYIGEEKNFNLYKENKMLRRSVERELEIIGEAISNIDKIDRSFEISAKKQILGLRNRDIHNYDAVDDVIIWGIVLRHLPILKAEITSLLSEKKE